MKLLSYKNDPKLKDMFVAEIMQHRKADQIIQGTYGEENGKWRGCAVGCSIHSLNNKLNKTYSTNDHSVYETELGIPEWLARLEDTIFEGLPKELAKKWPEQFAKAVPVGANLEPVKWKFCAYLMKENIDRVLKLKISDELNEQVVKAIRDVLALHETAIKTGKWSESAESAAWSAGSAAESAARSAAWSAESAAESAAWSAGSAAESAAESAESAAESARSAAYIKHSKKLLALLKEAKGQGLVMTKEIDKELGETLKEWLIEYFYYEDEPADLDVINSCISQLLALIASREQAARKPGYDVNMLGSWVFIGDGARLENLDDLYWSYVIEFMSDNDPWSASHDKRFVERVKKNMKYASFGSVGEQKALARADQRAKERIKELTNTDRGEDD